jgi:lathosterol oxidase
MEISLESWGTVTIEVLSRYLLFASISFVLFYVILKKPLWFRKIQKIMPKFSDYRRDIMWSVITVIIFATVILFTFVKFRHLTNTYDDIDEYGYPYLVFSFFWMLFLHDTWFYWWHRAMHHPVLFKHVHLVHHKSTNPSPWTAYAFHPLEAIIEVGIHPLLAFTLPIYTPALGLFFLFQITYNVYGHLGFELYPKGFHKHWFGKWVNTSVAHNLHHKKFDGNYGLYLLFWDRMMGTLRKDYNETFELSTQKVTISKTEDVKQSNSHKDL